MDISPHSFDGPSLYHTFPEEQDFFPLFLSTSTPLFFCFLFLELQSTGIGFTELLFYASFFLAYIFSISLTSGCTFQEPSQTLSFSPSNKLFLF